MAKDTNFHFVSQVYNNNNKSDDSGYSENGGEPFTKNALQLELLLSLIACDACEKLFKFLNCVYISKKFKCSCYSVKNVNNPVVLSNVSKQIYVHQ